MDIYGLICTHINSVNYNMDSNGLMWTHMNSLPMDSYGLEWTHLDSYMSSHESIDVYNYVVLINVKLII